MGMKIEKDSVDLGIVCDDGPGMLGFYRDVLGLEHVADTQLPKPFAGTMHRLMCGTSLIKLVVPEKSPGNPPAPGGLGGGTGYRYWTITVGNLDEVVADAEGGGHKVASAAPTCDPVSTSPCWSTPTATGWSCPRPRNDGLAGPLLRLLFAPRGSSRCGPGPNWTAGSAPTGASPYSP